MKYNIGDKVRIKSIDWYNKNIKNNGIIICGSESFTHPMSHFCDKVVTIVTIQDDCYRILEDDGDWYWTDEMIEGLVEEPPVFTGKEFLLKVANIELPSGTTKIWECPKGYQFVDENGNVINTHKIVLEKKKREYPKTYEECCEIVKVGKEHTLEGTTIRINYKIALLESFQKLLICRDAYWKLYGEEMGLNRPWEPDYDSGVNKYGIICLNGVVQESNPTTNWERHLNKVLDFPTEETRDAFYENFKELIEQCKELL